MEAGFSLRQLGRRLGVSASLLSQIENGRSDPSVSSLYALVTELGLSLDALLQTPEALEEGSGPASLVAPAAALPIIRPHERRALEMDSGVRWERMTPGPDPRVDALLTTYEPGGSSSSTGRLMTHPEVEYAYLIEGELALELGFETRVIVAGDSVVFESSTPHLYRNGRTGPGQGRLVRPAAGRGRSGTAPAARGRPRRRTDLGGRRAGAAQALTRRRAARPREPRPDPSLGLP